jgi:hypothetical protein
MSSFFDTTSNKEYNMCNLCQADVKKYRNDEWNMQMHINSKHPDTKEVEDNESGYNDLDSKDGSDENDSNESTGENTDAETDESDENDSNESDGRKSSDAETDVSGESDSDSDDKKRYLSSSDSEGSKHQQSIKKLKSCKQCCKQFQSCLNNPEFVKIFFESFDLKPAEILNSNIVPMKKQ